MFIVIVIVVTVVAVDVVNCSIHCDAQSLWSLWWSLWWSVIVVTVIVSYSGHCGFSVGYTALVSNSGHWDGHLQFSMELCALVCSEFPIWGD